MTDLNPEGIEKAAEELYLLSDMPGHYRRMPWGEIISELRDYHRTRARAAVAAYLDAQTVTTVEGLDALPVGVTIICADGWPWLHDSDGEGTWWWERAGSEEGFTSDEIPLPATVLYRPTP